MFSKNFKFLKSGLDKVYTKQMLGKKSFCYLWRKMGNALGYEHKNKSSKYDNVILKFGSDARKIVSEGIGEMALTVSKTFGPLGKNVAISDREENDVMVTKDGVTVAKYIQFGDRKKNLGCRLLSALSSNTNEFAGDGTTTATILAGEIVK